MINWKPGQVKPGGAKLVQPQVKPAGGKNNVMADKNGNVYKRDAQGNWQERQGNQWSKPGTASRPPTSKPSTPSHLPDLKAPRRLRGQPRTPGPAAVSAGLPVVVAAAAGAVGGDQLRWVPKTIWCASWQGLSCRLQLPVSDESGLPGILQKGGISLASLFNILIDQLSFDF